MNDLIAAFIALFRLRAGPQDLPYSPRLLAGLVMAEMCVDLATAQMVATAEHPVSLPRAIVAAALTVLAIYVVLAMGKKANRFVQTATAWMAVKLVSELVTLPMLPVIGFPPPATAPEQITLLQGLLSFPLLAVLVWWLMATTSVMRNALELRAALAFPIVVAMLFCVAVIASF